MIINVMYEIIHLVPLDSPSHASIPMEDAIKEVRFPVAPKFARYIGSRSKLARVFDRWRTLVSRYVRAGKSKKKKKKKKKEEKKKISHYTNTMVKASVKRRMIIKRRKNRVRESWRTRDTTRTRLYSRM